MRFCFCFVDVFVFLLMRVSRNSEVLHVWFFFFIYDYIFDIYPYKKYDMAGDIGASCSPTEGYNKIFSDGRRNIVGRMS